MPADLKATDAGAAPAGSGPRFPVYARGLHRDPAFRVGVTDMLPQVPGIMAWGLMTGVAMMKSGLSPVEAMTMAIVVYAGSSQLASLPLLAAGAPAWVVLATGFCVNLRFIVFSLDLRRYLMRIALAPRVLVGYLTADLNYIFFVRRHTAPPASAAEAQAQFAYAVGGGACSWMAWTVTGLAGIALAQAIPARWGLAFAGTLCLIGVLCSLATTRLRALACAIGGIAAVVAWQLPLKLNILVAIAAAVAVCLALEAHEARTTVRGGKPRA